MITIAVMVLLALLIVLERMKKIKLANMGGAVIMMLGSSICLGIYAFEFFKSIIAIVSNIFDLEDNFSDVFNNISEGISSKYAIFQIILLITLFIPLAIGTIYIIISLIKRPIEKIADESSVKYSSRCGIRSASLAIVSSAVMIVCIVIFILASVPNWSNLKDSIQLLNPFLWLFALFFTFGIGIFYLLGAFAAVNAQFMLIMLMGSFIVFALYVYSVILGIASCVRAVKSGAVKLIPAVISGVCMFMMVWNIIPMIYIRRSIKKHIINPSNIV